MRLLLDRSQARRREISRSKVAREASNPLETSSLRPAFGSLVELLLERCVPKPRLPACSRQLLRTCNSEVARFFYGTRRNQNFARFPRFDVTPDAECRPAKGGIGPQLSVRSSLKIPHLAEPHGRKKMTSTELSRPQSSARPRRCVRIQARYAGLRVGFMSRVLPRPTSLRNAASTGSFGGCTSSTAC